VFTLEVASLYIARNNELILQCCEKCSCFLRKFSERVYSINIKSFVLLTNHFGSVLSWLLTPDQSMFIKINVFNISVLSKTSYFFS